MKSVSVSVIIILMVSCAAFGGVGDGRSKFIEGHGKRFNGCTVVGQEAVGDDSDFTRVKGEAKWVFVLPFERDERIRFIDATVSKGRFVKGVLHTYGFKDESIASTRFEKLRRTCPMIGIRNGGLKSVKKNGVTLPPEAVLYPPTTCPMTSPGPVGPQNIHIDPVGYALDRLRHGAGLVRADLGGLRYEVMCIGADGTRVMLGIGTAARGIHDRDAISKIRAALEMRYPERKGAVSDRDAVDFYASSTVVRRGVK